MAVRTIKPRIYLSNILHDAKKELPDMVYQITFTQVDKAFEKIAEIAKETQDERLIHICKVFCYIPSE